MFFNLLAAVKLNSGMESIDWAIVIGMSALMLFILIYCNRFMHNAADFLAASRCAGRYVMSIAAGIAGFAVVSSVATFEMFYQSGLLPNGGVCFRRRWH